MGFRKDVLQRLTAIESLVERLVLEADMVKRLEGQNDQLFEKLMARDFDDAVQHRYTLAEREAAQSLKYAIPPAQNEDNIGEVLSDEELTG